MKRLSTQRARILHAGVALCSVALLLLPLAARSARPLSDGGAIVPIAIGTTPPVETPIPRIYVERDPFAEPSRMYDASRPQSHAIVRAVASGPRRSALIEDDGRTQVVSIGDRVDGSAVIAIDADGIVLADGARIRIRGAR